MALDDEMYCTVCGSTDIPKRVTKGKLLTGAVLFLLCFLPGVLYVLWSCFAWKSVCDRCGSDRIVPLDAPRAREALRTRTDS